VFNLVDRISLIVGKNQSGVSADVPLSHADVYSGKIIFEHLMFEVFEFFEYLIFDTNTLVLFVAVYHSPER